MAEGIIEDLLQTARRTGLECGYRIEVERSHPTEAVYVRVQRGEYWFGLRIASHEPAYECSADFQQLLVPVSGAGEEFCEMATRVVETSVRNGGYVVADPEEVSRAIQSLFVNRLVTGRRRWPSTAEVCAVRHRLNVRAAWSYEIETGVARPAMSICAASTPDSNAD